jgi:deoxyribose-phosphate aldolase
MENNLALQKYIDHTLLRPEASESDIVKVADEAIQNGFQGLCIEPKWLKTVVPRLKGSRTLAVTVISFPHGNDSTEEKCRQTAGAIRDGADEIDMVLNRDLLKERKYTSVYEDISQVVKTASGKPVKVILETSELTQAEKAIACALCKMAGASFVKTSTGFSKSGATVEDVKLMRSVVGPELGVKASGGVRSYEDAQKMIEAGATRLGTSSGIAIVRGPSKEASSKSGAY